jgi:hypothetical protein
MPDTVPEKAITALTPPAVLDDVTLMRTRGACSSSTVEPSPVNAAANSAAPASTDSLPRYFASSDTFRNEKAATPRTSVLISAIAKVNGNGDDPPVLVAATVAVDRSRRSVVAPVPANAPLTLATAKSTTWLSAASEASSVVLCQASAATPATLDKRAT